MKPDNWTLLSWAVSFGEHGFTIAAISGMALVAIVGGTWWNDRRNQIRHQAIKRAHAAAPRPAPSWAHPDIADDGDWERLHAVVHQHGRRGDQQHDEIYNRQGETK